MEKEFLTQIRRSVTLNVTGGKIDSFREKEETTGTVRAYDNGCIGIAGCLGEPDEQRLTEKAAEALALGIPYPCHLEGALEKIDLHEDEIIPVPELIPTMQRFLDRLGEACPRFAFSNKITLDYKKAEYRNSLGRHLVSSGRSVDIGLIVQNRGSGNLFDAALGYSGDRFDPDALLEQFKKEYDAFYTPVDIEPGRYPVVMESGSLFGTFLQHFVAEMYVSGASLLSGKLGQKAFSDKLSLRDRSIVTVTALMAQGLVDSSFQYHLMSAKKNGVTKEEIAEILTHAAFYAGWPKAWAAFRLAKEVWKDD